ncbi:MAG: restriction endonuclease [Pyrinomonadaceae bacterium]
MFLFFHTEQIESNLNYHKGKLFEGLLKKYLDAEGYDVTLRQKHNSLEYDIEGEDRTTKRKIIGEAKAHSNAIPAKDLTSFVGKILPLGLNDHSVIGLFLSTAPLTSEAEDYLRTIEDFGIVAYTGESLQDKIKQTLKLPNAEPLAGQLRDDEFSPQGDHILHTDNGTFVVLTASTRTSHAPSHFAVFDKNGKLFLDNTFIKNIAGNVPELKTLTPILADSSVYPRHDRIIAQGVIVGDTWIDYRFPAAPEFFVGRREFIERILRQIESNRGSDSSSNVLQIKSRSGVGKSSTLAYLQRELSSRDYFTELHDARDISSVFDIFSIIQRFTECSSLPADFRAVEEELRKFAQTIDHSRGVFMVDQFESTFLNPEVFQAYETLATIFLKYSPSLWICFARKNDQITTYDETLISLTKLNSIAHTFELKDFTQVESTELLQRANSASDNPVSAKVLAYVLEFAQGFPWLVKRTLAHITTLSNKEGFRRGEFESVLRLDDLFDEELEGLDEIEREYLTRIASRLPASFNQLQSQFDEDPILPKILDKLTQSRLLRLSGLTYDTYNDVFKEYLVYRKLPEFKQAIIYRSPPKPTLESLHWATEKDRFTVEDLKFQFQLTRGSAFNRMRELTALNLIKRDRNGWSVPQTVIDIVNKGRLGEYIRGQLVNNTVVANLLNQVAQTGEITTRSLANYLEVHFPFVQASSKTWQMYSANLLSWLLATKLIELNDDVLCATTNDRREIIETLGNLSNIPSRKGSSRRNVSRDEVDFLPNSNWGKLQAVVSKMIIGADLSPQEMSKVTTDLRHYNWMINGKLTLQSVNELREKARLILSEQPYADLWNSVERNESLQPAFNRLFPNEFSPETLKWRLKTLISWGKGVGLLQGRRIRYEQEFSSSDQIDLFGS